MPALPSVSKVIAVRLLGSDASDSKVGTHFDISYASAAPSISELNSFATTIANSWSTDIAPLTSNDFTLDEVTCIDLTSPTAFTGFWTGTHAGTRGAGELPLATCFTMQYLTVLRRRGGKWHGQHRWGITSDLANAQTWTTGFVSTAISGWTAFINLVLAGGWSGSGALEHVGVQYYGPPNRIITGSTGRVRTVSTALVTPVQYPVLGYAANTRLGSERRRLGKSGT